MMRTFFEYHIQRSLDESPHLPGWLRIVLRCDSRLRRFADDVQRLNDQLRAGARQERQLLFPGMPLAASPAPRKHVDRVAASRLVGPMRKTASLGWFSAAAVAATVVVVILSTRTREHRAHAEHAQFLSQQLTAVPEEMAAILTLAVNSTQSQLPRYNPLTQLSLPDANLLTDLSTRTQVSLKTQFDSLVSPWQALSAELLSDWNLSTATYLSDQPQG